MKTKLLAFWLKIKKGVIIAGLILACLTISFLLGKCSTREERDTILGNLIAARDSVKQSFVTIEGLNYTVTTKDAIILSKEDALKVQILENERLKALHIKELVTNAELTGVVHRQDSLLKLPPNTVFITIKDTSGVARDYVRIPFQLLKINEKFLSLNAGMNQNRTAWFDLQVPVSGEMSIGYVKAGFLKTKPVGIFTSQNPYLKINSMDILIVKEDKHFYNKTWFHMLAGAVIFEAGHQLLIK
jgi:hypothetical protein